MKRDDSKGLIELCDNEVRRKEGSTIMRRQNELENMKARQYQAKQKVHDKNVALR